MMVIALGIETELSKVPLPAPKAAMSVQTTAAIYIRTLPKDWCIFIFMLTGSKDYPQALIDTISSSISFSSSRQGITEKGLHT